MNDKNEKAYEKVIEHIKNEIWQGTLKRGERLPPERELADSLGVSRNSVREAHPGADGLRVQHAGRG